MHKIEHIHGVGKYKKHNASGDITFKKATLIYADNGSGKTTLASIFRSLKEDNAELIYKRKTFGIEENQSIKILSKEDNGSYTHHLLRHKEHNNSGWSNNLDNLEIFDVNFVTNNVFSGFEISDEHKKQLHKFVIGEQGVELNKKITQNKSDKADIRTLIKEKGGELIELVGNGLSSAQVSNYLKLESSACINLESEIEDATNSLSTAKANSVIQTLPLPKKIVEINIEFQIEDIKRHLTTTLTGIQNDSLSSLFNSHCDDLKGNSVDKPESWIQDGVNYLKAKKEKSENEEESCPFCMQKIAKESDILICYADHFNEEFKQHLKNLKADTLLFTQLNYEGSYQSLNASIDSNNSNISSWGDLVAPPLLPDVGLNKSCIDNKLAECRELLDLKLSNPTENYDVDALTQLDALLRAENEAIKSYNNAVMEMISAINQLKQNIATEQSAQAVLNALKRKEKRYEPSVNILCTDLKTKKDELKVLEEIYPKLIEDQETASALFLSNYKSQINHYLKDLFRTPFSIESVEHVKPQGRATVSKLDYILMINGHDISFDIDADNSIANVLSEGDKSTIALALFMAKLDIESCRENKILVFDDPLSSLDSNRRGYTVKVLVNLVKEIKQVIVLSHNEFFLSEVSKSLSRGELKTLQVVQNYQDQSSLIRELDLNKLVQNDYFKNIGELENFLSNADISKKEWVLGLLRNILESHIRFKFYRQVSGIPDNQKTFGRLIDTLNDNHVPFRDNQNPSIVVQKLRDINVLSCKPHHGEALPDLISSELNPESINVRELCDLITDTFDLIDNRL